MWKMLEIESIVCRALKNNEIIEKEIRENLPEVKQYETQMRNYCRETGRARGVKEGLSHKKLREYAESGKLAGYRRSTW